MTRGLGNILSPVGQTLAGAGVSSGANGIGSVLGAAIGDTLQRHGQGHHEDDKEDGLGHDMHPFEPMDLINLKPVNFEEKLQKLFPNASNAYLKAGFAGAAASAPLKSMGNLAFSFENVTPVLQALPAVSGLVFLIFIKNMI